MSKPDVVIVGGGPAGSAAAIWLAKAGVQVVLIERQHQAHHKVCGEFVSAVACRHLRNLGLDLVSLGSVPIERIRLTHGRQVAEAPLPFYAESLPRFVLDEALLETASRAGVDVRRGLSARKSSRSAAGIQINLSDGSTLAGSALFLATGKHNFRGHPRRGNKNDLIGFKIHLETPTPLKETLAGSAELLLFDGGYAGLQSIGSGHANLCLLMTKTQYRRLDCSWPRLLSYLAESSCIWGERLMKVKPIWDRPLSIYGMPYGYVADPSHGPVFRLGDQMAVIPSFSGDGIAIALSTAKMAADCFICNGPNALAYHQRAGRMLGRGVRTAAWGSRALEFTFMQSLIVRAATWKPELLALSARATRLAA